jgi:hypothetical protein
MSASLNNTCPRCYGHMCAVGAEDPCRGCCACRGRCIGEQQTATPTAEDVQRFGLARCVFAAAVDWQPSEVDETTLGYPEVRQLLAEHAGSGTAALTDPLPTREQVCETIAAVRDAAPRLPNDADTEDIIDALVRGGLLRLTPDVCDGSGLCPAAVHIDGCYALAGDGGE